MVLSGLGTVAKVLKDQFRRYVKIIHWNWGRYSFLFATGSLWTRTLVYCQILARQEEIPRKTSKNISRYFSSSFQGHV